MLKWLSSLSLSGLGNSKLSIVWKSLAICLWLSMMYVPCCCMERIQQGIRFFFFKEIYVYNIFILRTYMFSNFRYIYVISHSSPLISLLWVVHAQQFATRIHILNIWILRKIMKMLVKSGVAKVTIGYIRKQLLMLLKLLLEHSLLTVALKPQLHSYIGLA